MSFFPRVGTKIANVHLKVANKLGVQIVFFHRIRVLFSGGVPQTTGGVTLQVKILSDGNELVVEGGIESERRVLQTEISTSQANFALSNVGVQNELKEPIIPGDEMLYEGRLWACIDPIPKDKWGKTYSPRWVQKKRLTSGG